MKVNRPIVRYAVAAAMVPLALLVLGLTISLATSRRNPDRAAKFYPTADALARVAERDLLSNTAAGRAAAARNAKHSLDLSPANPRALTVLGLVAATLGQEARSERLLSYAEAMSRRHTLTQVSLLEIAVRHNNVDDALTHYDRAMRVSLESRMTLLPVLVAASDDPTLQPKIARLLAHADSWKGSFIDRLIDANVRPATLATLALAARLDPADPEGKRQLTAVLGKLVGSAAFAQAGAVFDSTCPSNGRCTVTPINGTFEMDNVLPPFGWDFISDRTDVTTAENSNHVLEFASWSGGDGARQLLRLRPGQYEVLGRFVIPDATAAIGLTVRCATSNVVTASFSAAVSGPMAREFTIPQGCPYQWLTLSQASRVDRDQQPAWVDDLSIHRLAQRGKATSSTIVRKPS